MQRIILLDKSVALKKQSSGLSPSWMNCFFVFIDIAGGRLMMKAACVGSVRSTYPMLPAMVFVCAIGHRFHSPKQSLLVDSAYEFRSHAIQEQVNRRAAARSEGQPNVLVFFRERSIVHERWMLALTDCRDQ